MKRSKNYWLTKLAGAEFKVQRLQEAPTDNAGDTPEAVVTYLKLSLPDSARYSPDTENMMVVFLSTRRRIIGWQIISNGTLDTLLVHPREIFKPAILMNAAAIILAHNHPSGDPTPSEGDIKVTRDLIRAGQMLKIDVLDHIILGRTAEGRAKDYVSLNELGYFPI